MSAEGNLTGGADPNGREHREVADRRTFDESAKRKGYNRRPGTGSRRKGRSEDGGARQSWVQDEAPRDHVAQRPELPTDVDPHELDQDVRKELLTLPKGLADLVGTHLVAAGRVLDDDPQLALAHARFARSRASRIAAVREAAGVAAYRAGEWSEALAELRAARRLGGDPGRLALLADCERALGRPERAVEIARSPEAKQLDIEEAVELRIVAAGERRDLGQFDAAVVALQGPDVDAAGTEQWRARLRYAYADNLLAAGREQDAIRWFLAAADVDVEGVTDAAERAFELSERPEPQ